MLIICKAKQKTRKSTKNYILVHSYVELRQVSPHTKVVFTKIEILYKKIHQIVLEQLQEPKHTPQHPVTTELPTQETLCWLTIQYKNTTR